MPFRIRMLVGVTVGLALWVTALKLAGGHVASFVFVPSLMIVASTAALILLGTHGWRRSCRLLRVAFAREVIDEPQRAKLTSALDTLERSVFVGGYLALIVSATYLVRYLDDAEHWGPNIAVALVGIAHTFAIHAWLVLPLKHVLATQAGCSTEVRRVATILPLAILMVCAWPILQGEGFGLSIPSVLMIVAAVAPAAIVAGRPMLSGPGATATHRWLADAVVSGAMLSFCAGIAHVCSVLDRKYVVPDGVSAAMIPLVYGAIGAAVVRARGAASASWNAADPNRDTCLRFAVCSTAALMAVTGLLWWGLVNNLWLTSSAPPR